MSSALAHLPFFVAGITGFLMLLASWDGAARRREQRSLVTGPAVLDAVEVRLAVWPFLAAFLWTAGGVSSGRVAATHAEVSTRILLAPVAALLLLGLGVLAGRTVPVPAALHWVLAPYHGLAGWILWLRAVARRRDLAAGSPETVAGVAPPPPEPEDSPRRGVRDLAELRLEEVMIPRSQVVALQGSVPVRDALAEMRRRPHALYPVHGDSVDQPLGVVRILDLGEPEIRDRPIREFVRPAPILPETVRGLRLFRDLATAPIPAVLVVDEFGGMAGLVTVEDLVEVLVGDLEGEHEVVRARIVDDGPGRWRIDGTCTIEEINRRLGGVLPVGEYETVAGLILDRLGVIPPPGEEVRVPGARLEVEEATDRRILWVRVFRTSSDELPSGAGA